MDQSIRRNLSGRARASTSGSSRRSASIVFLSLGLGGLLGFGRGGLPTTAGSVKPWSRSLDTLHALSGFDAEAAPRPYPVGRVLPETPHDSNQLLDISFPTVDDTAPRIHMENSHQEDENAPRPHGKDGKDGLRDRHPHDPPPLTPEQKRRLIGRISAWACTTLYLTSRLPQIWKNVSLFSVAFDL